MDSLTPLKDTLPSTRPTVNITPENQNQPILTHTYFKAPIDIGVDIKDIDGGFEQELPLFKALNPLLGTSGRRRSFWGRVEEDREQIILITVWKTRKALADFESSPAHTAFHAGLVAAGGGPVPTTVYIDPAGPQQMEKIIYERMSITTVYFPHPITESQKISFFDIEGLIYGWNLFPSRANLETFPRGSYTRPSKGWVDTVVHEKDGRSYELGIIWHSWTTPDLERTFRLHEKCVGDYEDLRVEEKYERDLKEAGAERWTEVHCDFEELPDKAID
ncbi:MAG: hypothetical protein Q9169_007359 [Polycauliona sp. 2 TL-2023]